MNEENASTAFPSGANRVELVSWGEGVCVKKTFSPQLKSYPVRWPMSRVAVEGEMLELLAVRTRGTGVRVPAVLAREKDALRLEYCPGTPLMAAGTDTLSDPSLWQALFAVLRDLWDLPRSALPPGLSACLDGQEAILACMLSWKTDGVLPPGLVRSCLCLGDVSLNNILYDGQGFTLLDLECAHWGYRGYDIGQLLAMAEACWAGEPVLSVAEQAFFRAVPAEADRRVCLFWKEKLLPYYLAGRTKTDQTR